MGAVFYALRGGRQRGETVLFPPMRSKYNNGYFLWIELLLTKKVIIVGSK